MEKMQELVKNRRSVRTYDSRALSAEDKEKLSEYIKTVENPYGMKVDFKFMDANEYGLKCPVVVGTDLYIGGKIQRTPFAFEAFGYSFEAFVLYAQSLGIGTLWLGGTMNRAAFEKAMELGENEMMPCASALGYPAEKRSLREKMMRGAIKADSRIPFEELFFNNSFAMPLSETSAGALAYPLEMVRWAPSAVNKQPWRVVVAKNAAHFYLQRSKGFGAHDGIDMQRIDMGIALCHFDLAAKEVGLKPIFMQEDPCLSQETGVEYLSHMVVYYFDGCKPQIKMISIDAYALEQARGNL